MKPKPTTGRVAKALTSFVVLALAATACGSDGSTTDSTGQADVAIGSIESGCAEAIELRQVLDGATPPNMSADDMRELADGANSMSAAFPNRPSEVGDYMNLVRDVTRNAADSAAEQGDLSAEQVRLLLDFEMAGRRADFERLAPAADQYFASACGDAYDNTVASLAAGGDTVAVASADEPTTTTAAVADATDKGDTDEVAETTTTEAPVTGGEIVKDLSSVGASGSFLGTDLVVGEIWRTNLTAESAIMGGPQELGEQTIVLVHIRLTTGTYNVYNRDSDFGFVSAEGFRTNATDAFLETGESWDLDLDANESKAGYLVFEGGLGDLASGTLQWVTDGVPSNIVLGQGATTQNFPVELPTPEAVVSGITNTNGCLQSFEVEVRDATVGLEAFRRYEVSRAGANERVLSLELAIDFTGVTGEHSSCQYIGSLFLREAEFRLLLDNGDSLSAIDSISGTIDKGSTDTRVGYFAIPATATAFDLVDVTGTVLASWSDVELPEP